MVAEQNKVVDTGLVVLTYRGELPTMNEVLSLNRFQYSKLKKRFNHNLGWSFHEQYRGNPVITGAFSTIIRWYRSNKKFDSDNVGLGQKFIFDGLQHGKVIKNDTWNQTANGILHQFAIDKKDPRVEVYLLLGKRLHIDPYTIAGVTK